LSYGRNQHCNKHLRIAEKRAFRATTTGLGATILLDDAMHRFVKEDATMAATRRKRPTKPSKPYPSFPLTAHNNGQWCKKIRGSVRFFGVWDDPQGALDSYLRVAADLHAGREPQANVAGHGLTVKDACNHFLTHQLQKVEASEISARWFEDCRRVLGDFARCLRPQRLVGDLAPDDFLRYRQRLVTRGLAGRTGLGVHALNRAMTRDEHR